MINKLHENQVKKHKSILKITKIDWYYLKLIIKNSK